MHRDERLRRQRAREVCAIHRTNVIRHTVTARPHARNGEPTLPNVASLAKIAVSLVVEAVSRVRCGARPVQEALRQVLVLTEFIASGSWVRCWSQCWSRCWTWHRSTVLIEVWALQEVVPIGDAATICP